MRQEVIGVFLDALKLLWYLSVIFSGVAFLLALAEEDIPLRTELETEFGLEAEPNQSPKAEQATFLKTGLEHDASSASRIDLEKKPEV